MITFMSVNGLVYTVNEPELHYTPAQKPVVEFSVAANKKWTDQGGSHEDSCFIDCVVFGKLAEAVDKNVRKGDPLYIEGELKLDRWEDQQGGKHSRHRIILSRVIFLKPKES
jgi:single-strand DNA-binding protein